MCRRDIQFIVQVAGVLTPPVGKGTAVDMTGKVHWILVGV